MRSMSTTPKSFSVSAVLSTYFWSGYTKWGIWYLSDEKVQSASAQMYDEAVRSCCRACLERTISI